MNKMWGGVFKKELDPLALEFTKSIQFDKELAGYDCQVSIAHAKMLGKCKIISQTDAAKLASGLTRILKEIEQGAFKFDLTAEDIHTNIQNALAVKVGRLADKLHAGRSRNDQVATSTRLYSKDKIAAICGLLIELQKAILKFARADVKMVIPGLTHTRYAQPVLLAHHMLGYLEQLERDKNRLIDAYKRTDVLPLGSCALAGTSLAIDRKYVAKLLGFREVAENSMDAVSDRDFALEILSDLAILGMHLSRLSADLILWSGEGLGFLEIDESFSTGSSIMPQKKNPDVLELIRGEASALLANYVGCLSMMHGLPLTYNRDMQLDKKYLIGSIKLVEIELAVFEKLVKTLKVNEAKAKQLFGDQSIYATDLAEYLIKKGIPQRDAHTAVGKLISYCRKAAKDISSLTPDQFKTFSTRFERDVYTLFHPQKSVDSKTSQGGTSTRNVTRELIGWTRRLSGKVRFYA